jgi:hypothetical protein
MPTFRVHFAADPHEPFPPLDGLPSIEADDPVSAVRLLVEDGERPADDQAEND